MGRKTDRRGVVYSTDPDFEYNDGAEEAGTLPPEDQLLYVSTDRRRRKGKTVTLIEGFVGSGDDLAALERSLKKKCGVGGSSGDGEILIQGDIREKVIGLLKDEGYSVKRKGG